MGDALVTTLKGGGFPRVSLPEEVPALALLAHPDLSRMGEVALLAGLVTGQGVDLSRLSPSFGRAAGMEAPLNDPFLSRSAHVLRADADGAVTITPSSGSSPLELDGVYLSRPVLLDRERLRRGVVLLLGERVALVLHLRKGPPHRSSGMGLVGCSDAMARLEEQIDLVADLEVPVLIRGETGVGKELVANALHARSKRSARKMVTVNMAALAPSVAASELFGHKKGAFTGATSDHAGYFAQADGSTLFLDEIGDVPAEVQPMLLRALESGEIQVVGGQTRGRVNVRLIAATDLDLESAARAGRFRAPLLERLASYQIRVPPLNRRREDIGDLLLHFLTLELQTIGQLSRLSPAGGVDVWLPARLAARLALGDWPGNVRQLRNVVRQMVISCRRQQTLTLDSGSVDVPGMMDDGDATDPSAPAEHPGDRGGAASDARIRETLASCRWDVTAAASRLGMSRTTLYERIARIDNLRVAKELGEDELRAALIETGGDLEAMVDRLQVSRHGVASRLRQLGLK